MTAISTIGGQSVKASTSMMYGKISYYVPYKPGYHGKWITANDSALDDGFTYLPKGHKVIVTNQSAKISKTLEKWDHGNFPSGVVVDVLTSTFRSLGGNTSDGYIYDGRVEWIDPF